jgi:predicted nucleic acid-binding protein
VTLTDAGPLIALIDAGEPDHAQCVALLSEIELPLVTTWPAFTEAMYLLGRAAGWQAQEALWRLALRGDLEVLSPSSAAQTRAARLMERYADLPMDLADATLVALAEERGVKRIFTLDSDFQVYRLNGRARFEIVPSPKS